MKLSQIVFQLHWCPTFQQVEYTDRSSTDTESHEFQWRNLVHYLKPTGRSSFPQGVGYIKQLRRSTDNHWPSIMVFPTDVSSSGPRLRHPAKEEWGCLLRTVIPFMLRMRVDRVLLFWMLTNKLFGRIFDNFTRTTKEASVQCELESEKIYFEKLHRLYSKPVHAKENTDVRLGYRVDTNTFLVKAYFTFGVRTVVANTSHIIQTTVAGMLFFRVPEGFYANEDVPDGSFLYEDQFLYEKFELQPHSAYCVPSGTRYVTMTYQKLYFLYTSWRQMQRYHRN
ncbi:uncharacterized protein CEXT_742711 [Caerostris extrusa]|uniref:Uncharacterized protein n=1 Tax=Caerostris extrusa TaxID=172846 RepID=A0AAV4U8P2_CAEEX|nr:uncharacterized protein CEXT_742711 [Caerostris extrusa]